MSFKTRYPELYQAFVTVASTRNGLAPKSPADATKFLNGAAAPAYAQVKDSDLLFSDVVTNNVSTAAHGFVTKAPNDTEQFYRGDAAWAIAFPQITQGRLTLTSGTPVTTSDVATSTNVFFTPYGGNRIALYTSSNKWKLFSFTELTQALGTLVNAQAYDMFAYDNAGTPATEILEWANAVVTMTSANPTVVTWTGHGMATGASITFTTTGALPTNVVANTQYFITVVDANSFKLSTSRANVAAGTFIDGTAGVQSGTHTGHQPQARQTALALQDGVLVKSGAPTRKYLGSFFATSTTQTADTVAKRFLWNYYNRAMRDLRVVDTTNSWSWTTATFHAANATEANRVELFIGYGESLVDLTVNSSGGNASTVVISVGIGEDSTNTCVAGCVNALAQVTANTTMTVFALMKRIPTIGYHAYIWLEQSTAAGATTWFGDNGTLLNQAGMIGIVWF